jgi:hypothetical protein
MVVDRFSVLSAAEELPESLIERSAMKVVEPNMISPISTAVILTPSLVRVRL